MKNHDFYAKTLFLLSGTFFLMGILDTDKAVVMNAYQQRLSDIEKATVLISFPFKKQGSGTLIVQEGEYAIMTNAHVCIENFNTYLKDPGYQEKFKSEETYFSVYGKKGYKRIKVKNSGIQTDVFLDICSIPVDPSDFDKKYFSFIGFFSSDAVLDITRKNPKSKELKLFTRNHTRGSQVFIKKGFYKASAAPGDFIGFRDPSGRWDWPQRGMFSISTIDVVPGDSGSAIYNDDLDLVGLAFGTRLASPDPHNIDGFLASRNIAYHEIPKLKNEIKELSGLYVPLDTREDYYARKEKNHSY